jgi:hypothetical protein
VVQAVLKEVKILHIEPNTTYRKCNEAAHMVPMDHLISQSSLGIFPIWTPIIAAEVGKLRIRPM